MSTSALATIFYGAVVPGEIVDRINKARADDPKIDQANDEGFLTLVKEAGFTLVSHGNEHTKLCGVAIIEHYIYHWADTPTLVTAHALLLPSIERWRALQAFFAGIECPDATIGWYVASHLCGG